MGEHGAFGFDPDDFDRMIREGSEGLRDLFERIGNFVAAPGGRAGWSAVFEDLSRRSRSAPETTGEAGDGVWAIYTVDGDGGARVRGDLREHLIAAQLARELLERGHQALGHVGVRLRVDLELSPARSADGRDSTYRRRCADRAEAAGRG